MHDVSYNLAFYAALASALLLSALSLCRELKLGLPRPVDRWAQPGSLFDQLIRALTLISLVILIFWVIGILR